MLRRARRLSFTALKEKMTKQDIIDPGTSTRKKKIGGGGDSRPKAAVKMSWLKKSRKLRKPVSKVTDSIRHTSPNPLSHKNFHCSAAPTGIRLARICVSSSDGRDAGEESTSASNNTATGQQTKPMASGIMFWGTTPVSTTYLAVARLKGPANE
mmetsp:Transcript_63478/g.105826  ORF Transcript_63478/g.105826 Transcript_63478/m.105826 type:complete len:154 (+) Transcript_63478:1246-1707(+)